ncbi:hypothetical protein EOL73_02050 [Candidatus Saccharibacteria bacterium]|nr:hypothetical protein [Candidatus Saccharibacteria bacterium]NCU40519.1 hypothetical protein [Candidatus Saccharibacteria bacterium]
MKKTDIAMLVLVVALTGLITYLIANTLLGSSKQLSANVTVVEPISAEIEVPNGSIFNKDAINPGVQIKVGDSSNQQPF